MIGESTFDYKGKTIGLKFGTRCYYMLEKELDISLSTFADYMKKRHIVSCVEIIYCAAVSYCMSYKKEQDFTKEDVYDWIDELGLEQVGKIIGDGFKGPEAEKKMISTSSNSSSLSTTKS